MHQPPPPPTSARTRVNDNAISHTSRMYSLFLAAVASCAILTGIVFFFRKYCYALQPGQESRQFLVRPAFSASAVNSARRICGSSAMRLPLPNAASATATGIYSHSGSPVDGHYGLSFIPRLSGLACVTRGCSGLYAQRGIHRAVGQPAASAEDQVLSPQDW